MMLCGQACREIFSTPRKALANCRRVVACRRKPCTANSPRFRLPYVPSFWLDTVKSAQVVARPTSLGHRLRFISYPHGPPNRD